MKSNNEIPRICIVTPEIVGPFKNGGIGTHAFYLSKFLAEDLKYDTTVLFTEAVQIKNLAYWKNNYKSNWNINFFALSELPSSFPGNIAGGCWLISRSLDIYNWLREQNFNICHFQDYKANGFISIQAKRTGQAFQNTLLTCTTHSSCQWIREQMQQFPNRGNHDLVLDYAERYCVEFADFVISPSEYMLKWATLKGWNISKNQKVIPYLLEVEDKPFSSLQQNNHHLIFFGRLETRKGIEVFLQSLKILDSELKSKNYPLKVTFLGKIGKVGSRNADELITDFFANLSDLYNYLIISNYGHVEALNYLRQNSGALIIIPSLVDNFPYAALECVELRMNIIASNTGGIPEIFQDDSRLFEPNPVSLTEKIKECIFGEIKPLKKRYSPELARKLWQEFHTSYFNKAQLDLEVSEKEKDNLKILNKESLVSVCIPYFNHGEYLPRSLHSLEQQTYSNFEVVVVNDGSTEEFSNDTFEQMNTLYSNRNWLFLEQENGGVGKARNSAAKQASGNYLIFMNTDNLAEPNTIEKMVKSISFSGVNCLTCYWRSFKNESDIYAKTSHFVHVPIGACLEGGIYENVFGGANFIIDKEVFLALGGFNENGSEATADWEFLASLVLAGYSLDVIPNYLFLNRYTENSLFHSTNYFKQYSQAIAPYLNTMPLWQQRFIINAIAEESPDRYQLLTPQDLGLPPSVFNFLRSLYLKLSGGGLENTSPNLLGKFLNFIALQITRNTKR